MCAAITSVDLEVGFRAELIDCMTEYGILGVPVHQNFNPQKSGRLDIAVYFTVLEPRQIGNASRSYNVRDDNANHVESTHYEQRIQITCVSDEGSTDIHPQDLAATVRAVCGSLPFVERMRALHVGTQNPSAMRMLYFVDEHDNQALECNFDLIVSYNRAILPLTGIFSAAEVGIVNV
jgi:hypothetical protein